MASPLVPVKPMVTRPCARALRSAAMIFGRRPAGGGERQQHVAALAEALDLTREHLLKTVIIGDRGQRGRIRGQRDRRVTRPVFLVAADNFGGDMLRISSTAAVADDQEFFIRAQCRDDGIRDLARSREHRRIAVRALERGER